MANMQMVKTPMPEQAPQERIHNFEEVARGYTLEMAMQEAERCLQCKNAPCVSGCPVNVHIPNFIALLRQGDLSGAYDEIRKENLMPAVCGRVCPQEVQCESKCVRGIKGQPVAIGRLERFVADTAAEKAEGKAPEKAASNGKKVAVIGSGPASLTCAAELARKGYQVTVMEAFHTAGGVLMYGIPEFRLPKKIVSQEIEGLRDLGVEIETNTVVGKVVTIDELKEQGYEAIFIGTGAGLPSFMHIPGENFNGVYSSNEFLTRTNLMKAYRCPEYDTPIIRGKQVVVVGAGNVAMDSARCALRLGAEQVSIVYRRSEAEMPARAEEVHHAKEEGVIFRLLSNPVELLGDEKGNVTGAKCIRMDLGEPDASGRRRPVPVPGSEFIVPCDVAIIAIGQTPNPLIAATTQGLVTNRHGCIHADEEGRTDLEGVFAGGDIVTGAATVILAMGAGKTAARAMDEYLQHKA